MGSPLRHLPTPDRFLAQFEKRTQDECWLWKGSPTQSGKGYGQIVVDGKRWQAHRFSFFYFKGQEIDDRLEACHECDNPICVNPNHIFLGTHLENMRDMHRKGRRIYARGPKKTECKRGHSLADARIDKRGKRFCRGCQSMRNRGQL